MVVQYATWIRPRSLQLPRQHPHLWAGSWASIYDLFIAQWSPCRVWGVGGNTPHTSPASCSNGCPTSWIGRIWVWFEPCPFCRLTVDSGLYIRIIRKPQLYGWLNNTLGLCMYRGYISSGCVTIYLDLCHYFLPANRQPEQVSSACLDLAHAALITH